MNVCIEKLSRNYRLDARIVAKLFTYMEERTFMKGEYVVPFHKRDSNLYVVKEGIWRSFRLNDGKEYTVWFATESTIAFSIWGYFSNQPSLVCIESETDSTAYFISKSRLDELCRESLELSNLIRQIFECHALEVENDMLIFSDHTKSRERYLSIMKRTPDLLKYVSLKKIASYLFITPQSLSRIRRSIR